MEPVEIFVIAKDSAWRVRAGQTFSRPFASEAEAIQAAMREARKLAEAGYESRVVMRVMTCPFGPGGMGRAFPTRVLQTGDDVHESEIASNFPGQAGLIEQTAV